MFFATVGFRSLGHDGGCRVPTLYVTRCRTHYPGRCARLQTECNSQTSNDRRGDGHYHLVNLFFAHNGLGFDHLGSPKNFNFWGES